MNLMNQHRTKKIAIVGLEQSSPIYNMKDKTIKQFIDNGWDEQYPPSQYYMYVDVVYPDGKIPQLLFNEVAYKNFSESIKKEKSEVRRLVWTYIKRPEHLCVD